VCRFDQEFNGTRLNRRVWTVTRTAASGYRAGQECYVDSRRTSWVHGGSLHLATRKQPAPFTCDSPYGAYRTRYVSGMVTTEHSFAQTYGHFEIRARFPAALTRGLHSAIWMWPKKRTYGPRTSGEIDIVEHYSFLPHRVMPSLGYHPMNLLARQTGGGCTVGNLAAFHTFELDWNPQTITMTYDGRHCWTTGWTPAMPLRHPEPFDKPFFLILTEALGTSANAPSPGLRFPQAMLVDYVRAWSRPS
jgi:beta-glucanase (GH16 family)